MSYRNDEQVRTLDNFFNTRWTSLGGTVDRTRRAGEPGWFETFIFENPIPFGMNWFVTRDEIRRMRTCMNDEIQDPKDRRVFENNRRQKLLLVKWWSS